MNIFINVTMVCIPSTVKDFENIRISIFAQGLYSIDKECIELVLCIETNQSEVTEEVFYRYQNET